MLKGRIHSFESFGAVDGPGVRFVIFMQGCLMRCRYCHNVDTWSLKGDNLFSAEELLAKAERFRSYWGETGGITISGGEALLQIDFLLELFKRAKERNINIVLDTCGQPFTYQEPFFTKFKELIKYLDLIILDLKHIDDKQHRQLTGFTNSNILELFSFLNQENIPVWARQVLVPGITDKEEYLYKTKAFLKQFSNIKRIEVLPYHSMGAYKWAKLGLKYTLSDVKPPSKEVIQKAKNILEKL